MRRAALAAILVVTVVTRAAVLREPMRYDEAFTFLTYAVHPVGEIVGSYGLPNNHIFNTVLMHVSWVVLGNHLWSLRLPAFLAGCAIVPAAYLAVRTLYGAHAALWAAALTACSAPLVDFSVNARGYTLGILFVLLALWAAALMTDGHRLAPWPLFVVSCALAAWSVPTMGLGLAAVGVWAAAVLVLRRDARGLVALVSGAAVAGLITYLLYRPTFGQHGWVAGKTVPRDLGSLRALASATWDSWNRATPWPLQVVLGAAVVTGVAVHRRMGRQPVPVLAAALAVLVLSLLTGEGTGLFPRYWLAYLPFVLISAAAGFAWSVEALAARRRVALAPAFAVPVAAAVLLSVLVLAAGQAASEEPPVSDNAFSGYVRQAGFGEVAAEPHTYGPAVDYYLLRDHMTPTFGYLTPPMRQTGHAIVAIPGDDAVRAVDTMRALGAVPAPAPARLLRRFEYMSVWDVPIES